MVPLALVLLAAAALSPRHSARGWPSQQRLAAAARAPPPMARAMPLLGWLDNQLQLWRQRNRPQRLILVRHGQSVGNTNRDAYSQTPDSQISLTERGFAQGAACGLQIRELVGNESIRFYYSPYLRARQTLLAMLQAGFRGQNVEATHEPRLREQDFGNFQDPEAMDAVFAERQKFGRFYYRFPNGEAGTDVFDRMSDFQSMLFQTMDATPSSSSSKPPKNYVIVTHGLLMRIFLMCYLRWTVQEFEQVWNPSNCEIWVLNRLAPSGEYELAGRWRASPYGGTFVDIKYGRNRNQRLADFMKRPSPTRSIVPGSPTAFDGEELAHLRALPDPSAGHGAGEGSIYAASMRVLNSWKFGPKPKPRRQGANR
jgi:broad specificity phosphatase PhoE